MSSITPLPLAILDDYQQVALTSADWSVVNDRVKIDVFTDTVLDEDLLALRLRPYTIICAMRERTKFTASILNRLPNLKFIATTGARNYGIDVAFARSRGIVVSGTGMAGNPVLEHIWALILATTRNVIIEDANIRSGKWQSTVPIGLAGKTLGIIGVGKLGTSTAQIAKIFRMKVIGWSPNLTAERAAEAGVEFASSKEELLQRSDVVSLHMVLSETTRHLLGVKELKLMKPTAFLINTSRGPLVDEVALIDTLSNGKIAGAGLDVFDVEPLPVDHPIRKLKNVTLSPHNGYVDDTNFKAFWGDTVENIASYLDGAPKRVLM
ncbi:hypothetical protein AX17_000585 [Amanita inopinata Kibby_2008]|nr:hypothetical protein AX17_000585 [Amanita inopinata Kibby_2008]